MEQKVKIYVLVDPVTLKVRYIGRTKGTLKKRLGEHITKAKYNYCKTHKGAWIRTLLKINSMPYIRLLAVVDGWKASHEVERNLINKYKDRLVNHDDRGEGGKMRTYNAEQRANLSTKLVEYFKHHEPMTKTQVFAYGYDGKYLATYASIRDASKQTGIYHGTISKFLLGITKTPNRKKMQFSYTNVAEMKDFTRKKVKKTPSISETE